MSGRPSRSGHYADEPRVPLAMPPAEPERRVAAFRITLGN